MEEEKKEVIKEEKFVVKTENINGKTMRTVEVPLEWEGKTETIKMRKLFFGEVLDLRQATSDISFIGKIQQTKVNQAQFTLQGLLKSIMKAPFKINEKEIRMLDYDLGERLSKIFNKLCNPDESKKAN